MLTCQPSTIASNHLALSACVRVCVRACSAKHVESLQCDIKAVEKMGESKGEKKKKTASELTHT